MLMSIIALRLHIGVMAELLEILSRLEDQVANVVFDEFYNPKFHIPKTLLHPSTLNPKSRLVNPKDIIVFYPSLKVRIKMVSINMKSGTMNFYRLSKINPRIIAVNFVDIQRA
ncbi:hypothetical protein YC2023_047152 [Brassica napus]